MIGNHFYRFFEKKWLTRYVEVKSTRGMKTMYTGISSLNCFTLFYLY